MKNFFQSVILIFSMLSAGCFGTGAPVSFNVDTWVGNLGGSAKSWRTPVIIQSGIASTSDGLACTEGNPSTTANAPMSLFNGGVKDFYVVFNAFCTLPSASTDEYIFATAPTSFGDNTWPSDSSGFTRLDAFPLDAVAQQSQRPITVVDANGNSSTLFISTNPDSNARPVVVRKEHYTSNWSSQRDVSDTDVSALATGDTLPMSTAMAVDANARVTAVWCQQYGAGATNYTVYYNQYSTTAGWKFSETSDALTTTQVLESGLLCNDSGLSTDGFGLDVAFDSNGNGFFATTTSTQTIRVKRYDGHADGWSATAAELVTGATSDAHPKLFISSDHVAHLFFYRNLAGTSADLYYSVGTYSGTFAAPVQFDSSVGSGTVFARYDAVTDAEVLPPILKSKSNQAAIAFIKSDGTSRALWVSRYVSASSSWSTPVQVSVSATGEDVTWADLDIDSSGLILVSYSQLNSSGDERIFANIFDGQSWQAEPSEIDDSSDIVAPAGASKARPKASIDDAGNAVVVFTMPDATAVRRAVAVSYK